MPPRTKAKSKKTEAEIDKDNPCQCSPEELHAIKNYARFMETDSPHNDFEVVDRSRDVPNSRAIVPVRLQMAKVPYIGVKRKLDRNLFWIVALADNVRLTADPPNFASRRFGFRVDVPELGLCDIHVPYQCLAEVDPRSLALSHSLMLAHGEVIYADYERHAIFGKVFPAIGPEDGLERSDYDDTWPTKTSVSRHLASPERFEPIERFTAEDINILKY